MTACGIFEQDSEQNLIKVEGVVTDAQSNLPIEEASLSFEAVDRYGYQVFNIDYIRTNEDGYYLFEKKRDCAGISFIRINAEATGYWNKGGKTNCNSSNIQNLNFKLDPIPIDMVFHVEGTVTEYETNLPIDSATVILEWWNEYSTTNSFKTLTNEFGFYKIEYLMKGYSPRSLSLWARKKGYANSMYYYLEITNELQIIDIIVFQEPDSLEQDSLYNQKQHIIE